MLGRTARRGQHAALVGAIAVSMTALCLASANAAPSAGPEAHSALPSSSVASPPAHAPLTPPTASLGGPVHTSKDSNRVGGGPASVYYNACGARTTAVSVAATFFDRDNHPVVLRCGDALSWGFWYVDTIRAGGWVVAFDNRVRDAIANGQKSPDGSEYDNNGFIVKVETAPMADGAPQGIMNAFARG